MKPSGAECILVVILGLAAMVVVHELIFEVWK
jgi:hypothetical protein